MKMSNQIAIRILEGMAIDMTGALGSLKKSEPIADVIAQRLDAINMAISALQGQRTTVTTIDAVVATHRDELNALNNEELAEVFAQQMVELVCRVASNFGCDIGAEKQFLLEQNKADWLEWLQSSVDGDDGDG